MVAANKEATELGFPSGKIEVITSNVFVTVALVTVALVTVKRQLNSMKYIFFYKSPNILCLS